MKKRNIKTAVASAVLAGTLVTSSVVWPGYCVLEVSAASVSLSNYQVDSRIRLNSIGYLPSLEKRATIASNCSDFQLVKENGEVVFSGKTTSVFDNDSSEQVYVADFSSVTQEGTYCLVVPGVGKSTNFVISKNAYLDAYKTSMLGMYLSRCGTDVSATYNGKTYSHRACHTQDAYLDYVTGQHTIKESKKGWHDAGDYNKYVVNAGVTVGSMFMAWEQFKDKLKDVKLTMPESSNSIPDFLDEMKYEIEWLLTMQYPDGSGKVSHKVSTQNFGGFIMPENENDPRYFVPWGSAATADFVAMTAMAGRIFKEYDPEFANKCITAAKLSYEFLKSNQNNEPANQNGFGTGEYATTDPDDRLWAAAEMWETLGDDAYLKDFESRARNMSIKIDEDFDWDNVKNLGMFTYLLSSRTGKDQSLYNSIKQALISAADTAVSKRNRHGYGRPLGTSYYWGCNGSVARQTMLLQIANKLSPNKDYINTASDAIGHLFGRNYYGRSFVTGLGVNPPNNPHDRRSAANNGPWPGYLVGGGHTARGWVDNQESYETNEIAINWNGALIYALAGFVGGEPSSEPVSEITYGDVNTDGKVNSTDMLTLKRYILGVDDSLSEQALLNADVNLDYKINSTDLLVLKKYILGLVDSLPQV